MSKDERKQALTVWIPASLKKELNEVVEVRGEITRMVISGLRVELAKRKRELKQTANFETEKAS